MIIEKHKWRELEQDTCKTPASVVGSQTDGALHAQLVQVRRQVYALKRQAGVVLLEIDKALTLES